MTVNTIYIKRKKRQNIDNSQKNHTKLVVYTIENVSQKYMSGKNRIRWIH